MNLYRVAQQVTDEVLGAGSYAAINQGNPDPGVQAAIAQSGGSGPTVGLEALAERTAIVAFLRSVADECPHGVADGVLLAAADAIETGRHLTDDQVIGEATNG